MSKIQERRSRSTTIWNRHGGAIGAVARAWIFPLLALAALAGCSATAAQRPNGAQMPGTADGSTRDDIARFDRVARIGRQVVPPDTAPGAIDLGLSTRDALGAWSWPDGRIRASCALVDLLDDEELAAALAHEIGHLLDGGHLAGEPTALSGIRGTIGSEARADVLGCRLLAAQGRQPTALPRMLRTVAAHLTPAGDGPDPAVMLQRASAADAVCTPRS